MSNLIDATPPMSGVFPAADLPKVMEAHKRIQSKKMGFVPSAIQKESDRGKLYLFSVSPRAIQCKGASYGPFHIPACKPGQEYSEPCVVPGLPLEQYNFHGNVMTPLFHGEDSGEENPGFDFACQLLRGWTDENGTWHGRHLLPGDSLEHQGAFISATPIPSREAIEAARQKRRKRLAEMVAEANQAYSVGRTKEIITPKHYEAAKELGKTAAECGWLQFTGSAPATEEQNCPNCGKAYTGGTVTHGCGFVLDIQKYNQFVLEGRIAGTLIAEPESKKKNKD